jgi:predicted unusual protein kinase regulating ubiquinone biosynthesis (AarF/ABC1/UbiB family)
MFAMVVGCQVCWSGKTWLTETSAGGKFLAKSLRSIGVIGIKFGQYCSQRPDLYSDVCRLELSGLTTRNEPVPWNELKSQCGIDRVYDVDICPLGTSSLAQVHPMEWQTKRSVLKILLPEYETTLLELRYCRCVLETINYVDILPGKWMRFIDETEIQLDLTHEAEELVYAHNLFGGSDGLVLDGTRIRVPEILYSSSVCLIMERATGKPLHELRGDLYSTASIARRSVLLHMTTFGDQRFHADLQDGNVLFDEDSNTLWLINFGRCSHPPQNWTSPLSAILRYVSDKTCKSAARDMLCAVLSVTEYEATELLPIFTEMFEHTGTPRSIAYYTHTFFKFTRRVNMVIAPHTLSYLAAIATEESNHS